MIGVVDFTGIKDTTDIEGHKLSLQADLRMDDQLINDLSNRFKSNEIHDFKTIERAYVDVSADFDDDGMISEPEAVLKADYIGSGDDVKNAAFTLSDNDEESLLRQLNEYSKDTGKDLFNRLGDMAVDASIKISADIPVPDYEKQDEAELQQDDNADDLKISRLNRLAQSDIEEQHRTSDEFEF